MPPIPPRDLTLSEVEWLLRDSEGQGSVHRGAESPGHAYGRHVALTKTELWGRADKDARNGQIALFTAFISTRDQVAAAQETLNSVEGKWARNQFFQAPPTARFPRGSHNGMLARIYHVGRILNVRYAGGTGIMPINTYVMILARDDGRRLGLHVKTFYGTASEAPPRYAVAVLARGNAPFSEGP
jgi:hypothetical protein